MKIGNLDYINPTMNQFRFGQSVAANKPEKKPSILQKVQMAVTEKAEMKQLTQSSEIKEIKLMLDQEAYHASIAKNSKRILEAAGITNDFLDKIDKELDDMSNSVLHFRTGLTDFASKLNEFDTSIASYNEMLEGKMELPEGESMESIAKALKETEVLRDTHIIEGGKKLSELGQWAEINIHASMDNLNEYGDIWSLLENGNSEEVRAALDELSKENYGFSINSSKDIYEELKRVDAASKKIGSSIGVLKGQVDFYRQKLNEGPEEVKIEKKETDPIDSMHQKYLAQSYTTDEQKEIMKRLLKLDTYA